jgi:phage terminase small subunit
METKQPTKTKTPTNTLKKGKVGVSGSTKAPVKGKGKTVKAKVLAKKADFIELTEKEERFCIEYAANDNAVKSFRYIWPNYSYNAACVESSRLLSKSYVKSRVSTLQAERRERLTPTADKVLAELMKLAFYDPRNFFDDDGKLRPLSELDPEHAAVIGGIETFHKIMGEGHDGVAITTKIKLPDKKAALELLGKNLKLWKEVGSDDNPAVVINKIELVPLD